METNETDKMLKIFFGEHKQEISDNGFSKRVMRKLPVQTDRSWIVWVFAAIGMAITMFFALNSGLVFQVFSLMKNVPYYYLVAGIIAFPLMGTAGYYLSQNKSYRLI